MLLDILCLIYYVTAAVQLIPCMYRVWKRKSSEDYSLVTEILIIIGAYAWTGYIFLSEQTVLVYLGSVFDLIMATASFVLIVKYHKLKNK